eukprot:2682970-Pyramimonas_sp.AAC.1
MQSYTQGWKRISLSYTETRLEPLPRTLPETPQQLIRPLCPGEVARDRTDARSVPKRAARGNNPASLIVMICGRAHFLLASPGKDDSAWFCEEWRSEHSLG